MPGRIVRSTLAIGGWILAGAAVAQPPAVVPAGGVVGNQPGVRAVAMIYDTIPVTRDELADFLIARGGYEKIELLINRKIIEVECSKRKISVTNQEVEACLNEDLKGLGFSRDQFLDQFLPRYNKTYYEWMEDVIRPRLMLKKLVENDPECRATDEDAKKIFENQFGEKRRCQMIMWPFDQPKVAQQQFEQARKDQVEFDRVARGQANPSLAAASGHILPIAKHQAEKDPRIEKMAFEMKVGETSSLIECAESKCWVMLKLHEVLPPDDKAKFADHREAMLKTAQDKKIESYIPTYMKKLKDAARPTKPFIGPPAEWQTKKR
jgi:hypothetical protein